MKINVEEYLESVEKTEKKQAERWWRNLVPIETAGIRVAAVTRTHSTSAMDAEALRRYRAAYYRVRRNLPHCLQTFKLIVKNGENRKESICALEEAR